MRRTSRRCRTAASANEPAWLADVGAALAAATGRPVGEIAAATTANAVAVFGLAAELNEGLGPPGQRLVR